MTPIEEEIDYEGLPSNAGLGVSFLSTFLCFRFVRLALFALRPLLLLHAHAPSPSTVSRFTFIYRLSNMNKY